jgi:hypothetical protein
MYSVTLSPCLSQSTQKRVSHRALRPSMVTSCAMQQVNRFADFLCLRYCVRSGRHGYPDKNLHKLLTLKITILT